MAEQIGPGSLKVVVASSPDRSLREPVEAALRARCRANDVRHLLADTFLVHTEASTAEIRDWLAPRFGGQRDFGNALKLSVYSNTPYCLAAIFQVVPRSGLSAELARDCQASNIKLARTAGRIEII